MPGMQVVTLLRWCSRLLARLNLRFSACCCARCARPACLLQNLDYALVECQALVLAPTRELAQQIEKVGGRGALAWQ